MIESLNECEADGENVLVHNSSRCVGVHGRLFLRYAESELRGNGCICWEINEPQCNCL